VAWVNQVRKCYVHAIGLASRTTVARSHRARRSPWGGGSIGCRCLPLCADLFAVGPTSHSCQRRPQRTWDGVGRVEGSMIALPITATASAPTAISSVIIGLSSLSRRLASCVPVRTFERRQCRQGSPKHRVDTTRRCRGPCHFLPRSPPRSIRCRRGSRRCVGRTGTVVSRFRPGSSWGDRDARRGEGALPEPERRPVVAHP
jgi:hypothetical protein